MGRRRWRFVTIAAFLLFMIKDAKCQDENDFYYTPVERSFAQVQPPLFPNNRPSTFYEHGDNFRVAQPTQQPLFNEGHVRFPSPNYNQNPAPFQLPTGRSQAGTPYYINQPEFSGTQRQRFRPALPYNFQLVHPASTKRPDTSQIHSVAYQHDPSKPEQFLGQITINNPDVDYLQNSNRFKNIPFDNNSLKSNGQSGHITRDEDIDNDNQENLFDPHRVTTYNPNRHVNKQRLNTRPSSSRFNHHDPPALDEKITSQQSPNKLSDINSNVSRFSETSADNKALLDLEPLLEDDISDLPSFRELMKNPESSFDVEVIKSNESDANLSDGSKMMEDNLPKDSKPIAVTETTTKQSNTPTTKTIPTSHETNNSNENQSEEIEDEGEYEYYDEPEGSEVPHTTHQPLRTKSTETPTESAEQVTDIYDEYDGTDEPEKNTEEPIPKPVTKSFEVVTMNSANVSMVRDDNFKHFIDTAVIDSHEEDLSETTTLDPILEEDTTVSSEINTSSEDVTSLETPSILGQEVVSVVTTKSVVNGTISIPDVTFAPSTTKINSMSENHAEQSQENDTSIPVTTENWVVVASVQTSRSVSGARFLPFPTVEQDEKKQVLVDEEEEEGVERVTHDPIHEISGILNSSSSTENIHDKLDSIQSELSIGVLSGSLDKENKNIELITESTTESTTSTTTSATTTQGALNVFTIRSTQLPTVTEKSLPDPLPVMIKKFTHRVTTSTSPKPRRKPSLVTVMDDLAGLLPPGYKPRLSYKDKRTSTTSTTTTTTTTTLATIPSTEDKTINGTQGRSSGINSKNRVILLDDKSLLPKEYKPKEKTPDDLLKKFQTDDISKFLPPGYKPPESEASKTKTTSKPVIKSSIFDKIEEADISAFLPKDFKLNASSNTATETLKTSPKLPIAVKPVDVKSFLPPGFKLNETESKESNDSDLLNIFKVADVSSLLPPGFKLNNSAKKTTLISSTTKAPGGIKLVFPSRPGGKSNRKTTPKPAGESGPLPVTPKIQKGWPTRASTEFTGWPSPSTTPFSIEKYLNKTVTEAGLEAQSSTEATTRRTTTTTTTTTAPPPSTTPGICKKECDIAATIKIVAGVKWVPELLDHHTEEWQRLAEEVKNELNSVYSKSDLLKKWYKGIRIDGFTPGSVLVDYFIELNDVEEKLDTQELKKIFHKSLHEASPGSVVEMITEQPQDFDPDVMLGDQPDEERMKKSNEKMSKTLIDKSAGKLEIGKFVMDPAYTEFIVLPKREEPTIVAPEEESFLPQWGIAVIVIALASLLFVVIFGVTVLVNRQKSAKAKAPIPLSEDMLRELDKSHMGGYDDMHQMKERELPYLPSGKRMSTAFIEQLAYPNPGDSWRSEWTPQMQKYMQHYTPDSGRGSQIYGTAGNGYGYGGGGGSQIYGQTGGGSQVYGYTGEYPPSRSHYARRRSDYDSNF